MRDSDPLPTRAKPVLAAGLFVASVLAALIVAAGARAAELVYWDNHGVEPASISWAPLDGGVGGVLSTGSAEIRAPEGMAYDPVANRLYVAGQGPFRSGGEISYIDLDGSGGGAFGAAGALVRMPKGIAIDPVAHVIYWINSASQTIFWARLDGSEGGEFPLGGEPLLGTVRLTVDPVAGRIYWGNSDGSFHYAPLIGSAGAAGALEVKAGGGGAAIVGLSVDPGSNRIFWVEAGITAVYSAGLTGAGKEAVDVALAPLNEPVGLAFAPDAGRLYWANSGNDDSSSPIGTFDLASGSGGGVTVTPSLAIDFPQDPVVIKSPSGTGAPQVTLANGRLQCSQGGWAPDYVASLVFQSPRSFAYGWTLNGSPIAGATEASYAPLTSGSYACAVTATNQAGSTAQASAATTVKVTTPTRPGKTVTRPGSQQSKPADLQLVGKARHLKAVPGKLLILTIRTTNEGTVASKRANLCLKLTKAAKRALRAGKCQPLGALPGGSTDTAKLRLRVKRSADPGLYKLRIAVPGSQIKVTVRVLGGAAE